MQRGKYGKTSFCCKCSGPSKWVTIRYSCTTIFFANDSIYPNEPARRKLNGPDDNLSFVDNPVHPKEPAFCTVGCQDKNLTLQIVRIGRPFLKKTIKLIIFFAQIWIFPMGLPLAKWVVWMTIYFLQITWIIQKSRPFAQWGLRIKILFCK